MSNAHTESERGLVLFQFRETRVRNTCGGKAFLQSVSGEKIKQDNESMSVSRETLGECYETR